MNTPICDFVRRYAESGTKRFHMPGHKGTGTLGVEHLDITEIAGADSLFEADGIIRESERNASAIFSCPTFYSTEGSSLCIRAMVHMVAVHAKEQGRTPLIWAARNAHKIFLSALALVGVDVDWLDGDTADSYLSCTVSAKALDARLSDVQKKPTALYLTSPDYLGRLADVRAIAAVCHRHGVLLCVDNAHGAYLKFLPDSLHPIDLGADLVCDSAHKTLPVLTGGAYLHVSAHAPQGLADMAKSALSLFASTSPSYLILQSLDAANPLLNGDFARQIQAFLQHVCALRTALCDAGWEIYGDEEMKLTLVAKPRGYTGQEVADALRRAGIECEFADPDHVVLMLSPAVGCDGLQALQSALPALLPREPIQSLPPIRTRATARMSIRDAMLAPAECIPVERALGRILALPSVSCPPAVPIAMPGEELDAHALSAFRYYGIQYCYVVK
ncbi:MAG: aminotransferase class I/II-fold pyridoxal phosphate-dependent enzyme [Clostridia bacterium]|nr:aminotransferase class I/II-fold pyridoxal phosphate-dependent enzyme [Clostridia bacterium]